MKNTVIGILFCISGFCLFAQESLESYTTVVPPSPTVSSLGSYGNVPVGKFSGTAQFNIPIYQLKKGQINVPISLNYSTNGVKVDQIATWVGMGWSLAAGGAISRTVRGRLDESADLVTLDDGASSSEYSLWDLRDLITNYRELADFDTEPDVFAYNFNGVSGKFVIDNDGYPRPYPYYSDLKIEIVGPGFQSFSITDASGIKYYFGDEDFSKEYVIANNNSGNCDSDRGIAIHTTAWHLTRIVDPLGNTINFKYKSGTDLNYTYNTGISQYLSANLYDGNGCGNYTDSYTCVNNQTVTVALLEEISTDNVELKFNSTLRLKGIGHQLNEITINGNENPEQFRQFNFDYLFSNNTDRQNTWSESKTERLFLNTFTEISNPNDGDKIHTFEYIDIDKLPVHLSFSQDHWGYYNGANNGNNFLKVPKGYDNFFPSNINANRDSNANYAKYGALKKINYPTGGYSEVNYEAHTYWGPSTVYNSGDQEYYSLSLIREKLGKNQLVDIIDIPRQEKMIFTAILSCIDENNPNCMTEEAEATINIKGAGIQFEQTLTNGYSEINLPNYIRKEFPTGFSGGELEITLTLDEGSLTGKHYQIETYFTYYTLPPSEATVYSNLEVGGIRVKSIQSKSSTNAKEEVKNYYYKSIYSETDQSSGKILLTPNYIGNMRKWIRDNPDYNCDYFKLYSNSTNSLYNSNGHHIVYDLVAESHGDNFKGGGTNFSYYNAPIGEVRSIQWSDFDFFDNNQYNAWGPSKLKNESTIKKNTNDDLVTLKNVAYEYTNQIGGAFEENRNQNVLFAGKLSKEYHDVYPPGSGSGGVNLGVKIKECQEVDNKQVFSHYKCEANHEHKWSWVIGRNSWKCIQILGVSPINVEVYKDLVCYQVPSGTIIWEIDNINPHRYQLTLYDINTKWEYLARKTVSNFDQNGENPVRTIVEYKYNNPEHAQLSEILTTHSNGNSELQRLYYPTDYDYLDMLEMHPLIQNHQIALPIESKKEVNGLLVSGQLLKYNDKGQVSEVWVAEDELGTVVEFNNQNPYSYGEKKLDIKYDANTGNINEALRENGVNMVYLWGKNNTYPVAKIGHATKNEVQGINVDQELLNNLSTTDTELRAEIQKIREGLPNAQVTTYTYTDIGNLTSITDARGQTLFYVFDGMNRLKEVKDNNSHIIADYLYHYPN